MNKLLLLLILSFFSVQSFAAGCPDGSEPVKSVSDDGSYFVYNCGGQASSSSATNSNAGTVKVAMKPNTGDWLNESIFPKTLKEKMLSRYDKNLGFAMGDFNNDGVDDLFHLGSSNIRLDIDGQDNPEITVGMACDVSVSTGKEDCYSSEGHRSLNIFSMKDNVTYKMWNGTKQKWDRVTGFQATDVSDSIINKNPIQMSAQAVTRVLVADFNGDGVLDIFFNDAGVDKWDGNKNNMLGNNDHYYLSQADGTWLESTATHVTGEGVKKGLGLENFTHGFSVGDIDNDGDIDVVVTSFKAVGNNNQLLCYVNQGDGHMKVRICGDQHAWRAELGDIDNDGDLDIVIGGNSLASKKEWADVDGMGACRGQASCPVAFDGILLNDGTGNFFQRGFSFPDDVKNNGFTYHSVPTLSVADLDGDGDLDVVRSLIGRNYAGMAMSIEENIGNGQFRTVFLDEWCEGPSTKAEWPAHEGNKWGCWAPGWMFGDFNKDGFVDIVVDGQMNVNDKGLRIIDGTVYLSTGKFTYDIIRPDEENYPLADFGVTFTYRAKTKETETSIKFESSIKKNGMVVFEGADKFTKFDIGISLNNSGALLVGFKDLKAVDDKQAKVRLHIKYGNIDFSVGVCFEYYPQHTFMSAQTSFNKNDWGGLKKIMPSSHCVGAWELDDNKSKLQELGVYAVIDDIQQNTRQLLEALDEQTDGSLCFLSVLRNAANKNITEKNCVNVPTTKAQSKTDEDAEVAAAKAKRLAEEAAKSAETDTVDTEQSIEDELAAFEAELAAELGE